MTHRAIILQPSYADKLPIENTTLFIHFYQRKPILKINSMQGITTTTHDDEFFQGSLLKFYWFTWKFKALKTRLKSFPYSYEKTFLSNVPQCVYDVTHFIATFHIFSLIMHSLKVSFHFHWSEKSEGVVSSSHILSLQHIIKTNSNERQNWNWKKYVEMWSSWGWKLFYYS